MRIASIDIGTNTVLLLIAETQNGKIIPLRNEYRMPRLGKSLIPGGNILDDRIEELLDILKEYRQYIDESACEIILANATNAFRIASNSGQIIKRVKNETGIDINIIPGTEEARFSFLGAASAVNSEKAKMVIDVGGGSTEIILGSNTEITYSKSFPVGTVRLTEKFFRNDPPLPEEKEALLNCLAEMFEELKNKIIKPVEVIAVAGTPTSLSCMKQNLKEYIEEKVENSLLSTADFESLISEMEVLTSDEILKRFGNVIKGRNDVILSGAYLLNFLLKMNGLSEMIISSKGIRYGAVADFLNREKMQ